MAKLDVPYFTWRDGRPRWQPGPILRARGFKGQDLKDAAGAWLAYGPAIQAAQALNAAVRQAVLASGEKTPAPKPAAEDRTLAALFKRFKASTKYKAPEGCKPPIGARTKEAYDAHMDLLEEWAGDQLVTAISRAAIEDLHAELAAERGAATANAVMRTLRRTLYYAVDSLEWVSKNRAARLDEIDVEGRLEAWEAEEIATFVAAADYLGLESQADAAILGLTIGQRQNDILILQEAAYKDGAYTLRPQKTAHRKKPKIVHVRVPKVGRDRIEAARARKAHRWPKIKHTLEIISEETGLPYHKDGSHFRKIFRIVRAFAAGDPSRLMELSAEFRATLPATAMLPGANLPFTPMPSILGKQWLDLRDTAVTWRFLAGYTIAEICNDTGHTLATATAILDKHYFVRDEALSHSGGDKLEAYLAKANLKW